MRLGVPVAVGRRIAGVLGPVVFGPDTEPVVARRRLELASRPIPAPRGVRVTRAAIGGVPCEHLAVPGASGALLYLHGGVFCVGSSRTHRALAGALALRLGVDAWVLDYRLSPEHPHPAAQEDALAAALALANGGGRFLVAGDSAGGGLALGLGQALRDRPDARSPDVLILLSPWLDLLPDVTGARRPAPREPLLTPEVLAAGARRHLVHADARDAVASPLRGDLRGLPPIVVSSGGDDVLLPDADALEQRARAAGASLTHLRHPGMWHVFHAFATVMPAAAQALDAIAAAADGSVGAP